MYALKNKVQLIGRLGAKPEVKDFGNGKKLANINLAINESYRNAQGERITDTQWHRVSLWGKLAEIAALYADKGSEVIIQGKLLNKSYTDKEGNKRYTTEIQATELLLLGDKSTATLN